MSHVFISYAHKDQENHNVLDTFITELKNAGFTDDDIWYDHSIEAGSQWHAEIDTALEDAFAIVVLLAPAAMKSAYVTYEWSWALGSGTPLIPLVLEGTYDDIHPRLLVDRQCTDCRDRIPSHVIDTLKNYQELPPDTEYLNRLLMETVMPFRILARVSLWLYPYMKSGDVEYKFFESFIVMMLDKARELHSGKLPDLMTSRHGFTTRQSRQCRQLMKNILFFWKQFFTFTEPEYHVRSYQFDDIVPNAKNFWYDKLEASIAYFDIDTMIDREYKHFDTDLKAINLNRNPFQVPIIGTGSTLIIEWYIDDKDLVQQLQSIIYQLATKEGH